MESKSVDTVPGVGRVAAAALKALGIVTVGDLASKTVDELGSVRRAGDLINAAKLMLPVKSAEECAEDEKLSYLIESHSWFHQPISLKVSKQKWVERAFIVEFTIDPDHAVSFIVGWAEDNKEFFAKFTGSYILFFNSDLPPFNILMRAEDFKKIDNSEAVREAIAEIENIQSVKRHND